MSVYQAEKVRQLKAELLNAQERVGFLERILKEEQSILQNQCSHDNVIAEDDGDLHRPSYYYTCKLCGHSVRFRPFQYKTLEYMK